MGKAGTTQFHFIGELHQIAVLGEREGLRSHRLAIGEFIGDAQAICRRMCHPQGRIQIGGRPILAEAYRKREARLGGSLGIYQFQRVAVTVLKLAERPAFHRRATICENDVKNAGVERELSLIRRNDRL